MLYLVRRDIYLWVRITFASQPLIEYFIAGAIAVISLMTGNVVDQIGTQTILSTTMSNILSNGNSTASSNPAGIDPTYAITIATTLAFTVGIIQVS